MTQVKLTHLVAICISSEVLLLHFVPKGVGHWLCVFHANDSVVFGVDVFALPAVGAVRIEPERVQTFPTITAFPGARWGWGRRGRGRGPTAG